MWRYEGNYRWREEARVEPLPLTVSLDDLRKPMPITVVRREQRSVRYVCSCGFARRVWVDVGLDAQAPFTCPACGTPPASPPKGGNVLENICDQCGHHRNMHHGGCGECSECESHDRNGTVLPFGRCWSFMPPVVQSPGLDLNEGALGDLLMDRCAAALDNSDLSVSLDGPTQAQLEKVAKRIIEQSEANMIDAIVGLRDEFKDGRKRMDDIVGSFEVFRQTLASTSTAAHRAAEGVKKMTSTNPWSGLFNMVPGTIEAVRRENEARETARMVAYRQFLTREHHRNHAHTEEAFDAGWRARDDHGLRAQAGERVQAYSAWYTDKRYADSNDLLKAFGAGWNAQEAFLAENHPEYPQKQEESVSSIMKQEAVTKESVKALVRETLNEEEAEEPLTEKDRVWTPNGEGPFTLVSRVNEEQVVEAFNPERGAGHSGKAVYTRKRVVCDVPHWLVFAPDGSHRVLPESILDRENPNQVSRLGMLMAFLSSRAADRIAAIGFGITIIYLLASQ